MYPGFEDWGAVKLSNKSAADIDLDVSARLTEANGWDDSRLKEIIEVRIADDTAKPSNTLVDYHNLVWWNAQDRNLNVKLTKDTPQNVRIYLRVRTQYSDGTPVGNEIANKALSAIKFVVTGTQSH
jgi:hypothetical protein